MAKRRYLTLVENYMKRFERGGFLVGDVLKFNDNFSSSPSFKKLGTNIQELVNQMIESGLHVRVVGIRDAIPGARSPAPDVAGAEVVLDIALDNGGGRYTHYASIPTDLVSPETYYPNLPPIPDAVRKNYPVDLKPKELVPDDKAITNVTDKGDGKHSTSDYKLGQSNNTIPSQPATKSPEVNSYTKDYLKGLKEYK